MRSVKMEIIELEDTIQNRRLNHKKKLNIEARFLICDINTAFFLRDSKHYSHFCNNDDRKSKILGLIICLVDGDDYFLEVA